MGGNRNIIIGENYEGMEINISKNFGNVGKFYAAQFSEYVDKILEGDDIKPLGINKGEVKGNNLLVTIFNKLNSILPELLGIVGNPGTCNYTLKNIKEKYNLEQLELFNIIKNTLNDILLLSIGLKTEGVDENFEYLFNLIEEKSGKNITYYDLINFITAIDTTLLNAVSNHIDGIKYMHGNREKAADLIEIMMLERKRLIEHYLYKYNIPNIKKAKILRVLMNEENIDPDDEKLNMKKYIKYIVGHRSEELKNII